MRERTLHRLRHREPQAVRQQAHRHRNRAWIRQALETGLRESTTHTAVVLRLRLRQEPHRRPLRGSMEAIQRRTTHTTQGRRRRLSDLQYRPGIEQTRGGEVKPTRRDSRRSGQIRKYCERFSLGRGRKRLLRRRRSRSGREWMGPRGLRSSRRSLSSLRRALGRVSR